MVDKHAIIHPDAMIGEGTNIGPYTIIGKGVQLGRNNWIGPHVVINGPIVIGDDNKIYQFTSLGEGPQHVDYKEEPTKLVIGDGNIIREYCTFNRGSSVGRGSTEIGNNNFFMAYVHIAHDCSVGDNTIFANCASLAGHVSVGDYAILGGFTVMHQFCRVGEHSLTALGTISFKDIPPFMLAAGNPAKPHGLNIKGLKRRDFSSASIESLRKAYKVLYRSGTGFKEAINSLEKQGSKTGHLIRLIDFLKSSDRGIIR